MSTRPPAAPPVQPPAAARPRLRFRMGNAWSAWSAEVREAWWTRDNEPEARVLVRGLPGEPTGEGDNARLLVIGAMLGKVADPHVLRVVHCGVLAGKAVVVYEGYNGVSLDRVLQVLRERGQVLPVRAVVEVAQGVARALCAVGGGAPEALERVVHPGPAPVEVLIDADGGVKLAGLWVLRRGAARLGESGPYAAPEGSLDEAHGVYGIGALLAALLTGGDPPVGSPEAGSQEAMARALYDRAVARPGGDVPAPLAELMRQCLGPQADRRPRLSAVADRLGNIARMVTGTGLRAWAAAAVPSLLWAAPKSPAPAVAAPAVEPPIRPLPRTAPPRGAGGALPVLAGPREAVEGLDDDEEQLPTVALTAAETGPRATGVSFGEPAGLPFLRGPAPEIGGLEMEPTEVVTERLPPVAIAPAAPFNPLAVPVSRADVATDEMGISISPAASSPHGPAPAPVSVRSALPWLTLAVFFFLGLALAGGGVVWWWWFAASPTEPAPVEAPKVEAAAPVEAPKVEAAPKVAEVPRAAKEPPPQEQAPAPVRGSGTDLAATAAPTGFSLTFESLDPAITALEVRCHEGVSGSGGSRVTLPHAVPGPCKVVGRGGPDGMKIVLVTVTESSTFQCFEGGAQACR